MEVLFRVFPVRDAEREEVVAEQVLIAERLGLDIVGIKTSRTSGAFWTRGR